MTSKGMLIVVSGPSGVGKDTIVDNFLKTRQDCSLSVSATTRPPRIGEVDGVDYHFITRAEFEEYIADGQLLEYAEYSGNYYGTIKKQVENQRNTGKHVILIIETKGAKLVRVLCKEAISVFVAPPSFKHLKDRLEHRQTESAHDIEQRLHIAVDEMKECKEYNYVIVNEKLDDSVEMLGSIIDAGKCSLLHTPDLLEGTCE